MCLFGRLTSDDSGWWSWRGQADSSRWHQFRLNDILIHHLCLDSLWHTGAESRLTAESIAKVKEMIRMRTVQSLTYEADGESCEERNQSQ